MKTRRAGFTPFEIAASIALVVLLAGGVLLWNRVSNLNTWAEVTDHWLMEELYPWINGQNFQVGPEGAGLPDGNKPPAPPDGL